MSDSQPNDTSPAIEAILMAGYRRMDARQKLERLRALSLAVQQLALADIRRRHPEANGREVALRLASRRLEPSTMRQVFGWDPDAAGY
jgi:hypothetical protein